MAAHHPSAPFCFLSDRFWILHLTCWTSVCIWNYPLSMLRICYAVTMQPSSGHWSPSVSLTCCTNRKAPSDWRSLLHSASRGFLWPGGKHGRWPSPQPNPEPNERERVPQWTRKTEQRGWMQFKKKMWLYVDNQGKARTMMTIYTTTAPFFGWKKKEKD